MKIKMVILVNNFLRSLLILIITILQGCVAAAPLAIAYGVGAMALSGFLMFKTVQLSTGGSAEVRFKDSQISAEDQKVLKSIKHLAVWSDMSSKGVKIAELLSSGGHYEVITPNEIISVLKKSNENIFAGQLTEDEKLRLYKQVGDELKADGILIYSEAGLGVEQKMWSFKRSEMTTDFRLKIYSPKLERVIWQQEGQLVLKLGSKYPPQGEVDQILASACVEKLLVISGKIIKG